MTEAQVREGPPNAHVLAGFLTIKNNGGRLEELLGAESSAFEKVEIHMTYLDNGMMRMKQVPIMKVAPGQTIQFKPGGFHLMLINPKHAIKAGDAIEIMLHTNNDPVSFRAPVLRQEGVANK